jgi:catechol 2,3-dioxygenase-like lactoylglutathione lyase family enzyme
MLACVQIDLVTIVVDDYDAAIAFFTEALGFELVEDSPSLTNDGKPKRWVVVRPLGDKPGDETGTPQTGASPSGALPTGVPPRGALPTGASPTGALPSGVPPTGILLAQADGERQAAIVGDQVAGRVGFFLRTNEFDAQYQRMKAAGVSFVTEPRTEPYGRVAVFLDIAGNRWDLLGN